MTLYTIQELAEQNRISRKTVWSWIKDGKLKSTRLGTLHRISESDWLEFLATCNPK